MTRAEALSKHSRNLYDGTENGTKFINKLFDEFEKELKEMDNMRIAAVKTAEKWAEKLQAGNG